MEICTVLAKNYVAHARVLARSVLAHHPGARVSALVIDDYEAFISPEDEPFEILTPRQVGCDGLEGMAVRYELADLAAAMRPWLLRYLMSRAGGAVLYLDPDIRVYAPIDQMSDLADARGLVLIPYSTVPMPDDGHRPTQLDMMRNGIYNLGAVAVSPHPDVEQLMDWWAERLLNQTLVDQLWGYFSDQRWFDFAPGYVTDFAVLREPGYNLAYWNLAGRQLELRDGSYLVDEQPLRFFHFSGFDPEHPERLSRFQDRIDVRQDQVLEGLCADYARELVEAGLGIARSWDYAYGSLPGGLPFDATLRDLFRVALARGEVNQSPFSPAGADAFLAWLAEQQEGAPAGMSRLLARIYSTSKELQRDFPDPAGGDRERLLAWARHEGVVRFPALGGLPASGPQKGTRRWQSRYLPKRMLGRLRTSGSG